MNKYLRHVLILIVAMFFAQTINIFGFPGGVSGYTLKGSSPGCTCHTSSSSSSVTLTIQGPANLNPGETGNYTVQMTYTSSISAAGMDIASSDGSLAASDSKLILSGNELTHPSAQSGTTTLSWPFTFTAPSTSGTVTLYATGCSVKNRWNHAPNFSINVSALPVELVSFQANLIKNSVALNWTTATEVNNTGFDIERKVDNGSWEKINFVSGCGNSNSTKQYKYVDPLLSNSGIYSYRLKQIDNDGSFEYSNTVEVNYSAPMAYELEQNYPNPFNPSTTIKYSIPKAAFVEINICNALGQEVAELVSKEINAGTYSIEWNASGFASGVYYCRLMSGDFVQMRKLILLK